MKHDFSPLGQRQKRRGVPRYLSLRNDLARRIIESGWSFSEPIPSESKLAAEYGVALGTVRRAIDELVQEGVLDRRQGTGTFLRRSDFSGSLSRCLRFRSLHSTIAFQESRVLTAELRPAPAHVAEKLGIPEGSIAIYLDRRRYHEGELLVVEDIWLLAEKFDPVLEMELSEIGPLLYRTYEETCGQIIVSAKESLRVQSASAEVAATLGIQPGSPIIVIDRQSLSLDESPLEWRRSYAIADNFEYRIEIR